ncbi:MAG: U32 family peptidase [Eggerthellaceae bacterium]|nr:U32 family peptidase [Eggerthellaceae bacterium]
MRSIVSSKSSDTTLIHDAEVPYGDASVRLSDGMDDDAKKSLGQGSAQLANCSAKGLPELLAPAGGRDQLVAAIRFGANAVYLATDQFGMRQRAGNFSLDEIPHVVAYAHERHVAVHVTCNIQMHNADIDQLPTYLQALDEAGIDALIVSDLGAFRMAKRYAPHVALHVSTQASVSNAEAACAWYDLGASRIICAREMSLAEIAELRKRIPNDLQIEVFVHGSMCMAVSGRCLISDYLTDRSATNGNCTQPCRWSYTLEEETRPGMHMPVVEGDRGSYILNAKDLNMIEHLDDLRRAGVDSIKIEGRNKKAFYVASVVNAYRQVLDGADPAWGKRELDTVSHRPYGTGFYYGRAQQTPDSDDYIRTYTWAAEVVSCSPVPSDSDVLPKISDAASLTYEARVLCRNRFEEGDHLEVVSPHRPIHMIEVHGLRYIADDGGSPYHVTTANRPMESYSLRIAEPLLPGDLLRKQQ